MSRKANGVKNVLSKPEMRDRLDKLVKKYKSTLQTRNLGLYNQVREETIRVWLNEMLSIFGWNIKDTSFVLQEFILRGEERRRLHDINSTHLRPDYILIWLLQYGRWQQAHSTQSHGCCILPTQTSYLFR